MNPSGARRGLLLVALSAGLFSAMSFIMIKHLTRDEPALRIVLFFNLTAAAGSLPLVLADWRWPAPAQWRLLAAIAACATVGQVLMTLGFERAPISLAGAATLLTVVFTSLGGWLICQETLRGTALAGLAVLLAGVLGLVLLAPEPPAPAPQAPD